MSKVCYPRKVPLEKNSSKDKYKLRTAEKKFNVQAQNLSPPSPESNDKHFNFVMDSIRALEIEQMIYTFGHCSTCHERRLQMKMHSEIFYHRCYLDKNKIKMFSSQNNMDPIDMPYIPYNAHTLA